MRTSAEGIALLHHYESCRLAAYPDPGSVDGHPWTIGWGHTGKEVKRGLVWTQAQADAAFVQDLAATEAGVQRLVKVPLTQFQFDALVSFAYNVGLDENRNGKAEGLGESTLLRKLNAKDYAGAAEQCGEQRIAVDARHAAPDEPSLAIDQRTYLAIADRPQIQRRHVFSLHAVSSQASTSATPSTL